MAVQQAVRGEGGGQGDAGAGVGSKDTGREFASEVLDNGVYGNKFLIGL